MIRRCLLQVAAQRGKQAFILPEAAFQMPAQPAQKPFATEVAQPQTSRAGKVQVGKMSQHPGFFLVQAVIFCHFQHTVNKLNKP